jgi:hypothetical protein
MEENMDLNDLKNILIGILLLGIMICGYFLFRNNDHINFLKKESENYKVENRTLEDSIKIQDELLIFYATQFDSIQSIRDTRNDLKKGEIKKNNDQYEKDLRTIANDDVVASFWAISDSFRQHSSK